MPLFALGVAEPDEVPALALAPTTTTTTSTLPTPTTNARPSSTTTPSDESVTAAAAAADDGGGDAPQPVPPPAAPPTTTTTTAPKPTTTTTAPPTTTAAPSPEPAAETQEGKASWYELEGSEAGICAHRTLPFGTIVRVTNVANGKATTCEVGDRGPFIEGRVLDLFRDDFAMLASTSEGVIDVRLEW